MKRPIPLFEDNIYEEKKTGKLYPLTNPKNGNMPEIDFNNPINELPKGYVFAGENNHFNIYMVLAANA